ncbi:MAG TPA: hypothetical protein VK766_02215 [Cytophagaceae bacterium]|jgi:hypothetical protein|nr:hypothetical protein [Cytophagaceae bacterium]
MKQDQQHRQERILNSLKELGQVEPSPFLYAKILHRIEMRKKKGYAISEKVVWKTSFSFCILLIVNIVSLYVFNPAESTISEERTTTSATEEDNLIADNYYFTYSE